MTLKMVQTDFIRHSVRCCATVRCCVIWESANCIRLKMIKYIELIELCMKMLKFIGLIRALQIKLVHSSLVFHVCYDLGQYLLCDPV